MTDPRRINNQTRTSGTAGSEAHSAVDFCSLRSALSFCNVAFTQIPVFAPATRFCGWVESTESHRRKGYRKSSMDRQTPFFSTKSSTFKPGNRERGTRYSLARYRPMEDQVGPPKVSGEHSLYLNEFVKVQISGFDLPEKLVSVNVLVTLLRHPFIPLQTLDRID